MQAGGQQGRAASDWNGGQRGQNVVTDPMQRKKEDSRGFSPGGAGGELRG